MNKMSIKNWVEVFQAGLVGKYPKAEKMLYSIDEVNALERTHNLIFKSNATDSSVMAAVEYDENGKVVFVKFYTTLFFNDYEAILKVKELQQPKQKSVMLPKRYALNQFFNKRWLRLASQ